MEERYESFHKGCNYESYKFMGAHVIVEDNIKGVRFTTWAPNTNDAYVVGDFSDFKIEEKYKMTKITDKGIWSLFIPKLEAGYRYKFVFIKDGKLIFKADPYGVKTEVRPNTASIIANKREYKWTDDKWLFRRSKKDIDRSPINIYEVHLGSWKRNDTLFFSYEELADMLPEYVRDMGYTHVELMPIVEHPLDESWGYQGTGYYSPTSRYGDLDGLKTLINKFHINGIGVILDWVPGHFCKDEAGLYMFDGGITYEYDEFWKANNSEWGTFNFDLGRNEVKSFLISNAVYWINEFHFDGLRVDAVSNILYLDYGRGSNQWIPNIYGTNTSLEGIGFIKELNKILSIEFENIIVAAEESSTYPNVTKSLEEGGLGFTFKWNMGWMNDSLEYMKTSIDERENSHNKITFSMLYNYTEKYILPVSHDEVVHGKKSLVDKIQGDYWSKFAGLRVYELYKMCHPGKKLSFMGNEFAQFIEWREYEQLEWELIDKFEMHKKTHRYFKDINRFYLNNKALWINDFDEEGFMWIDPNNNKQSVFITMRLGRTSSDILIFVLNFKKNVYYDFRIGVPNEGAYEEIFNTDSYKYGGSNQIMKDYLYTDRIKYHNQPFSLSIKVPPMAGCVLRFKEK